MDKIQELKELKEKIEQNSQEGVRLKNKIRKISEKMDQKIDVYVKVLEYKKFDNNSHIIIGIITLILTNYITHQILNQPEIQAVLNNIILTTTMTGITKLFFENKKSKIRKANPSINFEDYDLDLEKSKIDSMHIEKLKLVCNLAQLESEFRKLEGRICQLEEPVKVDNFQCDIEKDNQDDKPKIKVMSVEFKRRKK